MRCALPHSSFTAPGGTLPESAVAFLIGRPVPGRRRSLSLQRCQVEPWAVLLQLAVVLISGSPRKVVMMVSRVYYLCSWSLKLDAAHVSGLTAHPVCSRRRLMAPTLRSFGVPFSGSRLSTIRELYGHL